MYYKKRYFIFFMTIMSCLMFTTDANASELMIPESKAALTSHLTTDIYRYDAKKGHYLTYINGKGYSQYSYLNKNGTYAFTPTSWMKAAGLTVTMPSKVNGYELVITNPYKTEYEFLQKVLAHYQQDDLSLFYLKSTYESIAGYKRAPVVSAKTQKSTYSVTKTTDIYRYDGGSNDLTTILNKGYSQFSYLNTSGNYAFTPSSWMKAAGLNVTMPSKENGYIMEIENPYINLFNDLLKTVENTIRKKDRDYSFVSDQINFKLPLATAQAVCRYNCYSGHHGIDVVNQLNKYGPILAAADGTVIKAAYSESYGNHILMTHVLNGKNYSTLYAHLSKINVKAGQIVSGGQQIGIVGNTGWSTGPHLHFEIYEHHRTYGQMAHAINPEKYLNFPKYW